MRWFSEQGARWTVAFCGLTLLLLLFACSATVPSSRKYVGSVFDSRGSPQIDESFRALWEKWTVYFGQARIGGKSLQLGIPFMMTGGRGKESEFPLQITATLMDSLLIEAGLQHYATLLKMAPDEQVEFRREYHRRYDPTNYLLIWCELHTTWAELHLDCDRWIIFIEDDADNQYEPVRILDESQPIPQTVKDRLPEFKPEQRRMSWEIHQKTLMLCFPKRDFQENPILSEKVGSLKLIFQLASDRETRADGIWVFKN